MCNKQKCWVGRGAGERGQAHAGIELGKWDGGHPCTFIIELKKLSGYRKPK